jgi:hypothetical protein
MAVTSQYELAADALKQIIDAEFEPEGWEAEHDQLHPSVGHERTRIGVAIDNESPNPRIHVERRVYIEIRFYLQYDRQINPEQAVDPRLTANAAERLRRAIQANQATPDGDDKLWWFSEVDCRYPEDPTGNKTRFTMRVEAHGNNTGLIETTG